MTLTIDQLPNHRAQSLTVGSLFAGIGGMDLGLERAGMTVKWQVEIDAYCQKVLAKHWPSVRRYSDVREVGAHNLEPVDLICGGFPCQDISNAGKRAGIDGERSGLWSEFARIICELRPRYVLVENVAALLGRGIGRVLRDLAESGYDAEWDCIPAAAVGAPHRRDRVWIVAYDNQRGLRCNRESRQTIAVSNSTTAAMAHTSSNERGQPQAGNGWSLPTGGSTQMANPDNPQLEGRISRELRQCSGQRAAGQGGPLADTAVSRLEGSSQSNTDNRTQSSDGRSESTGSSTGINPLCNATIQEFPHRSIFSLGESGTNPQSEQSDWWAVEPAVGRVANGVPSRVDRLKGLGNAVVPQVAEWVGRRIMEVAANDDHR